MPDRRKTLGIALLFLFLLLGSCADRELSDYRKSLSDGRYDSEFPSADATAEIGAIAASVRKIYSVSYYTTWQFRQESQVTRFHIRSGLFLKMAVGTISTQESVSGSGVIVMAGHGRIALLTCDHIVNAPDTLITWYEPTGENPMPVIRSISVRQKQENWVRELGDCGPFIILATDPELDAAFIGKRCDPAAGMPEPFASPFGQSTELGWGCFVYIFGYPMGLPAVTKAIVSKPVRTDPDEFTVDALLNKGYSGGIILAIRDGVPNFELVGMVKAVSSDQESYLRPSATDPRYNELFAYEGDVYAATRETVHYGLNFTVPSGKLFAFYNKHRDELIREGYDFDLFFGLTGQSMKK